MSEQNALMNLTGALDLIKMSKNPLAPIFEAMTNSLEALSQKEFLIGDTPEIELILNFTGLLSENKELEQIEIIDNGVGFTQENYTRFCEFFNQGKGFHNRGTGRLQYFHRFNKLSIESVYEENSLKFKRSIECNSKKFISNDVNNLLADASIKMQTKVILSEYSSTDSEKTYFDTLTVDSLVSSIKNHFMLRFYLDNKKDNFHAPRVIVKFFKGNECIGEQAIDPKNLPSPQKEGEIKVPYMKVSDTNSKHLDWEILANKTETIKWAHFEVAESELAQNGIYLCSKDIPLESIKYEQLKKNEAYGGKRFLTAFYGDVLDKSENVSHSVDSFLFPEKSKIEKEHRKEDFFVSPEKEFLFIETIEDEVNKAVPEIYINVVQLQTEHKKNIESIAKAHGIPFEIAQKAKINLSDDEKSITKKIYVAQATVLNCTQN